MMWYLTDQIKYIIAQTNKLLNTLQKFYNSQDMKIFKKTETLTFMSICSTRVDAPILKTQSPFDIY